MNPDNFKNISLKRKALSNFILRREQERENLFADGFNCGDPKINGEFETFKSTISYCDTLIDIGYNKGEHSLIAETLNQNLKIYGFEPNTALLPKSSKHQIFRIALSDIRDTIPFYIHKDSMYSGESSIFFRDDMNPSFRKELIEKQIYVDTLDNWFFTNAQTDDSGKNYFLKIDSEGAESSILRGGIKFLSSKKVIGLFEYSAAWTLSKKTLKDTFCFLENLDYSLFRINPFGLEHIRFFHPSLETYRYQNIFFANYSFVKGCLKSIEIPTEFSKTELFLFG